ncbi:hypothetical protein SAMN05444920_101803 [Nonomuraea solani]|uniref:Uncharacterized protein n=1 Tax=Nonomuraea solani TaxID=1144553 RepID=A0A1H5V8J5_9ACTN|nr:hypothetical protein [Nonomuraea solani]SEF83705.1 hypothetical protein SAMN05444920_101803 [Nonomuraea solani]
MTAAALLTSIAEPGGKVVEVVTGPGGPEVRLGRHGSAHLRAPLRGLLTASTGRPWRIEPAEPGTVLLQGGETVVITARAGALTARLELAFTPDGLLTLTTTWRNDSGKPVTDVAAGLLLPLPTSDAHVTMPGVLYNGNPSSDPRRQIPRIDQGFVCEEDRLPIPAVNAAWDDRYVSLFAHPEPARHQDGSVSYGSLGLVRSPGLTVAAMTGVIMFDGAPDVCYVSKAEVADQPVGYRDLAPGESISTRHTLDWGPVEPRGLGFRKLVHTELYDSPAANPLSRDELIRLKTTAMDARWAGDGYLAYEGVRHGRPRSYLYGWTGQCMKLARCEAMLGLERGEPERVERARRAAAFYVEGSATPVRGLRHGRYLVDDGTWEMFRKDGAEFVSSRAHGETIADLAELAIQFRQAGLEVPPEWEEAVEDAAALFWHTRLPEGIVPLGWTPEGTPVTRMVSAAGAACVQAMLGAYRLSGERVWLLRAEEVLSRYHRLHAATFERPFAHATLDASGEDKEAGMYYFQAAFDLYRLTGRDLYARWAEAAADWLLTFVYVWSPEFGTGSTFARRDFKACGWPSVSVQNHHLDVFFPTSELMEFGLTTGRPWYAARAEAILRAMGQGVSRKPGDWGFATPGEQGEGFFQTNWQRKGEANTWNPSWVIALPLFHALRMRKVP